MNEINTEILISRIKSLADEKGLSLTAVFVESGAGKNFKSNLKTAKPTLGKLTLIANYLNTTVEYLLGETDVKEKPMKSFENIFPIAKKKIPLLGEIACGEPIYANEDRESYVVSGTDIDADFCLKAHGDSMTGARILDGDIVFIKKTDVVNNGEIAAVIIEDEATLKRVYYYPDTGKLVLNAENPKYEPLVYVGDELNQIHILGKAIAFQSDVI